jgi:hypothetical protein
MARPRFTAIVWSPDPSRAIHGGIDVTRYERKLFFERLVAMRDGYRAEIHEATELTIDHAIAAVGRAFEDAAEAEDTAAWPALAEGGGPAD